MIRKALANKSGVSYVLVCVLAICVASLFCAVAVFAGAAIRIRGVKNETKLSLDSFVTENSTGNSILTRYLSRGKAVLTRLDYTSYLEQLKTVIGLQENGGMYYKYDSAGNEEYHMSIPTVRFVEPQKNTLKFYATYTMWVPLRFAGITMTYAHVNLTVRSDFNPMSQNTANNQ